LRINSAATVSNKIDIRLRLLTEGQVAVKSPLKIIRQMEKKGLEIVPGESPAGIEE
jgi:hypothetical protein